MSTELEIVPAPEPDNIQVSDISLIDDLIKKILRGEKRLSYSSFSRFKENPHEFIRYCFREVEETEAMIFGQVMHKLVLQPESFYTEFFVLDDEEKIKEIGGAKPRSTKAYKDWLDVQRTNAGSRKVITTDVFNRADTIRKNIYKNRAAMHILRQCPDREQKVEWDYGNFKWHGFKDASGAAVIADIKKVVDADPRKVNRDIIYMGYYLQAAMYLTGDGDFTKRYYIIAVDDNDGVSCHWVNKDLIDKGRKEYEWLIGKFSECILSDKWNESYEFFAERWDGSYDAKKLW